MVGSSISKISEAIAKAAHSTSTIISMLCIVLTWYMLGPLLHSGTWELLRYRVNLIKGRFQHLKTYDKN